MCFRHFCTERPSCIVDVSLLSFYLNKSVILCMERISQSYHACCLTCRELSENELDEVLGSIKLQGRWTSWADYGGPQHLSICQKTIRPRAGSHTLAQQITFSGFRICTWNWVLIVVNVSQAILSLCNKAHMEKLLQPVILEPLS